MLPPASRVNRARWTCHDHGTGPLSELRSGLHVLIGLGTGAASSSAVHSRATCAEDTRGNRSRGDSWSSKHAGAASVPTAVKTSRPGQENRAEGRAPGLQERQRVRARQPGLRARRHVESKRPFLVTPRESDVQAGTRLPDPPSSSDDGAGSWLTRGVASRCLYQSGYREGRTGWFRPARAQSILGQRVCFDVDAPIDHRTLREPSQERNVPFRRLASAAGPAIACPPEPSPSVKEAARIQSGPRGPSPVHRGVAERPVCRAACSCGGGQLLRSGGHGSSTASHRGHQYLPDTQP